MTGRPTVRGEGEELVFAVTQVLGSTAACAAQGDKGMFEILGSYYSLAASCAHAAGGRFVKGMGDSVLLVFPRNRAREAVEALRALQARANDLWRVFDERCRVQVKVGAGEVQAGELGPQGDQRFDIVGSALNALFKTPWSDFHISPQLFSLLR